MDDTLYEECNNNKHYVHLNPKQMLAFVICLCLLLEVVNYKYLSVEFVVRSANRSSRKVTVHHRVEARIGTSEIDRSWNLKNTKSH